MEYEEEEKELRLRRAQEAARPELSAPLPGGDSKQSEQQPVRMAAAVTTDRALAAAAVARVRMRLRLRALLQTQAGGADGSAAPSFAPATAKALSVDDSVVSRLSPADAVAEVADVLQTSWAISAACRSAMPEGGAPPALEVLKLGLGSLKRKLQAELVRAGKSSPSEDAAALAALAAQDSAAASEAVARATTIKQAVLRPVQEELAAACAESRQALGALVAATAKVRPEVEALRETHKEQTVQAVENLRTEREAKHAQTVALHKIAIGTQIEKERLEAALMYKEKPKMVTFRRVLACVKELSHTLKDLEVNGTANRKSQGILQHTLRALEGRAAKAESDGRGKLLFGQEEEEDKDFAPSLQVLKKQDRQVEQEEQFREALRCEIASLRADLEAKSTHEAAACGAQLRKEAEAIGEAAAEAHRRLAAWRVQASALRPWLAQVVPIAKSGACLAAAAAYVKTSMTPAALRAALARLAPLELLAEQAANATDASSPREDELPDLLGKLSASRKVLAELKAAFPNVAMPVQHQPAAEQPKSEDEDDEGAADREAVSAAARPSVATSKGTMRKPKPALKAPLPSIQVPSPPPFPSPPASSGRNHSATPSPGETPTDTPREDGSPLARTAPLPRPPPRPAPGAAAQGFCLNSATAGLAELGNELSALSSALSSGPPKAGPPSKALRPSSAAGARAPAPASSAPSAKPQRSAAVNARPNSSAGSRPAAAVAQAASVSMTALGGQGSALRAVQKARVPVSTSWD
ncbi:unnamed protein product [Polarella glacialis]|uniref:Uncharacterized protein n=1 Tax=Polarella glacialis TaxID=89957 RepID=A0A813L1B8_POLGL|nr:unnamed protein product [Polarella glacialis]